MKMWKCLAAAVLAAVLTMAMLTACGGDAAIVVDEEQSKNVTTWVQEAMQEEGYELTADSALTPMIKGGLPKAVAYRSAQINKKDKNTINAAYNDLCATLDANFAQTGKKSYVFSVWYGKASDPVPESFFKNNIKKSKDNIVKSLKEGGAGAPQTVAAGVARQGEYNYILIIISE